MPREVNPIARNMPDKGGYLFLKKSIKKTNFKSTLINKIKLLIALNTQSIHIY